MIPRLAVALVWLYQGLWCKLLARCPGHEAIVQGVPGLSSRAATLLVAGLGAVEAGIALWVLSGRRPRLAAAVQTALLVGMNAGGLLWGREHIADPGAMITQNLAFLTLAWVVAARAASEQEAPNPWTSGRLDGTAGRPQLLFGRMHEDWRIEAEVFRPGGRVFCVASSGCTARALAARGFRVTAVDVNPVQVEYARQRAEGAPERAGVIDRRLSWMRRAFPLLGLGRQSLQAFLDLSAVADQAAFWRETLCTWRFRTMLRCGLHPGVLRLSHAKGFVVSLPPRWDLAILGRLEKGWATHPNRTNPYAWQLLLGREPPDAPPQPTGGDITFAYTDAAEYLEQTAERFDGFTLSNILDAAPPGDRGRLLAAVRRAAAPGAVSVLRSFGEPATEQEAAWAAKDRAMLWGAIEVTEVS